MQIETTVGKAVILRLGYFLGGGGIAEQKVDRAARDIIAEALTPIAGVRLVDGGGFALSPAIVGEQPVMLELDTEQLARAMHKLRNGQWPALSDTQLDTVEELTAEVDGWLKRAEDEDAWAKLPTETQQRILAAKQAEGAALDAALGSE